jgi:hypothetical protein
MSTTDLPDVIDSYIARNNQRLYTNIPAIITDVSKLESDNVVSVQPAVRKVLSDGFSYDMAVIPDITVQWPSGGGALLSFPLAVGDDVLLSVSMVSIVEWSLTTSGTTTPYDRRLHDISDAFVIPCIFRDPNNPSPDANDVVLKYAGAVFKVQKDGTILLSVGDGSYKINPDGTHQGVTTSTWSMTNGTTEFVDMLIQILRSINTDTVNTIYGVSPLNSNPATEALIAQLESFKE